MSGAFSDVNSYVGTEDGDDVINVKSGSVLNYGNAQINAGDGNDTINLNQGSFVWISGSSGTRIYGGDGDDTFNVGSTGVLKDGATIYANEGNDTINFDGTVRNNSNVYGDARVDIVNINGTVENSSTINTRSGDDIVNMNAGAEIKNSNMDMGAGDDTLNIKGGTFSNVGIDLGSGNNTVTIEGSFGDADDDSLHNTYITNWQSGNDTVTIKSGATVKNANIGVHNGEDVITLEKGATLEHSWVVMGDDNDTLNINGTVTRGSHINLDYGEDNLNVGESAKISDSNIQTDDSGNGYKDTVNIANKVTLENWADIQAGGGNDEITIGENANISGNSTIDGGAGDDIISMTNGTKITNSSVLLGDGENTLNITRDSSKEDSDITLDSAIIQGGSDNDTVNIYDTTGGSVADPKVKLENDTSINLGDGNNEVTVDGSVLLGKIENGTPTKNIITTGSGRDTITLQNGASVEERVIETGEGIDHVNVFDGASLNFAKIETGKGDDVVRFDHLTANPLQGYTYSAATDTKINMGDGRDTLVVYGMGNKGNYAGRTSDFQQVNVNMGDNGVKTVQMYSSKIETTNITTGSADDLIEIKMTL